jgi:phosphoribosylglycinamide formyltransferase-1
MAASDNFPRIALLISGQGSNMKVIIKKAREGLLKINPVLVFSDNPNARGLDAAKELGVETESFRPKDFSSFKEYEQELVKRLVDLRVDLIICAGYMRLLKQNILNAFKYKIINIHPALLPSFPGLDAQVQAFEYGVKVTGCTVHFIDEGVDTGPVIMQKEVYVDDQDTLESLTRKIQEAEHDTYWRAIDLVINGYTVEGRRVKKVYNS